MIDVIELPEHDDDHLYGPGPDEEVVCVIACWDENDEVPADYVRKVGDRFEAIYNDYPVGQFVTCDEARHRVYDVQCLDFFLPWGQRVH